MVMGMVKMVAKEFYNLTIEIKLEEKTVEVDAPLPYHYKLAIALADGEKDGGSKFLHMPLWVCVHIMYIFCRFFLA